MRQAPDNIAIKDEGLKVYLDRTSIDHNDKGYDDFIEMVTNELGYTKPQMAKAFAVSKQTIYKWLEIYEAENARSRT